MKKLTDKLKIRALHMLRMGHPAKDVAEAVSVSLMTISNIARADGIELKTRPTWDLEEPFQKIDERKQREFAEADGVMRCVDCLHTEDQHWIHGCRAAYMRTEGSRQHLETCSCLVSRGSNGVGTRPNCFHCAHFKVKGRIPQCAFGYWSNTKDMEDLEKDIYRVTEESEMASDCADFYDLRPAEDELKCAKGGCEEVPIFHRHSGHSVCRKHQGVKV